MMHSWKSIKEDGRMKKFISVILAVIIMLSFAGVHAAADEGSVRDSAPKSDSVAVISDENEADSSHKIVTEPGEDDIDEDAALSYSDDVPSTGDQNKYIIGVIVIAAALILVIIVIVRKKHE